MSVDDWRNDKHRAPWVRNSLSSQVSALRAHAHRCRRSFNRDYMGELANYLADAYDEAADVFQQKLDECRETAKEGTTT